MVENVVRSPYRQLAEGDVLLVAQAPYRLHEALGTDDPRQSEQIQVLWQRGRVQNGFVQALEAAPATL